MTVRTFSRVAVVVAMALAFTGLLGGPAFAQTQAVSLAGTTVQVQVWPEIDQNTLVIVGAVLPTDTPLPATVELPLPLGASVQWAGEIEGTSTDLDIQRAHEIVPANGGSAVRFTIEQHRSFQYEAFLSPSTVNGDQRDVTLDWVHTVPSLDLSVAWRFPAGVTVVSLDPDAPGQPVSNAAGETLYTLVSVQPQPGDTLAFKASYRVPGSATEQGGGVGPLQIVIGLLVVAATALVIALARQRQATGTE